MNRSRLYAAIASGVFCVAADWRIAEPGLHYEFPRDHLLHDDFKTEWWYLTGNLFDQDGRRFGYELTFFREGIRPPRERTGPISRFVVDDLKFAHFTITDVSGKRFLFYQKTNRGAFGEAGFVNAGRIAWIESWNLRMNADGTFDIAADADGAALQLHLAATSQPVAHGENGASAKATGEGHASHYYSIPRLTSEGELRIGAAVHHVRGDSWFDHEWATNQLAPNQAGWNWICVQFDDGSALMLYQMRLTSGEVDPISSGTLITADGTSTFLPSSAFAMTPQRVWKSARTGANYPIGWRVRLPRHNVEFTVKAALDDQELALPALTYWEGAIDVSGTREGKPISGRGYLELTGYAGALNALSR
jgi:predicted secreted hydrolase